MSKQMKFIVGLDIKALCFSVVLCCSIEINEIFNSLI